MARGCVTVRPPPASSLHEGTLVRLESKHRHPGPAAALLATDCGAAEYFEQSSENVSGFENPLMFGPVVTNSNIQHS